MDDGVGEVRHAVEDARAALDQHHNQSRARRRERRREVALAAVEGEVNDVARLLRVRFLAEA